MILCIKKRFTRSYKMLVIIFVLSLFSFKGLSAPVFSDIYVFGDSLSDTGNTRANVPLGSFESIATIAGYGQNGRFSNGLLWHENLAQRLGLSAATASETGGNNYAYGGARVDNATGFSSGMFTQEADYLSSITGTADPDALYIAWFGGNDMRDLVGTANPVSEIESILDNLLGFVDGLINIGVSSLLIPNLPDLGSIPEFSSSADASSANFVSMTWNSGLRSRLDRLVNNTAADIFFLDVYTTFNDVLNNPADFGFSNTTDECRSTRGVGFLGFTQREFECANADEFLFWDEIHPTTAAHSLLGQKAFSLIENGITLQRVSAPSTILIIALCSFGLIINRRISSKSHQLQ